ncbi:sensor histidine kinase [Janthinobacterium psychrotolerans]|uniref:histidine kinase n=1 Tax=Janthinobacterium psychrotolerans TaxID=1747903 RepID=A0A1A7C2K7_9BURK|nr:ATP-binding protein [Janthinobacterium psychrotolerans]OBV39249.1 two-component system, OmpR family, sensor kinase/two-component system, OmpR family, sensor histidine kinase QseC [Janthinobacterium psychrotolerans]
MTRPSWSLRRTLLAGLLGLTVLLWGSSAAIIYVEAQQESAELFDQSLVETGHLLLSLVENDLRNRGGKATIDLPLRGYPNPHHYLRFKVRDAQQNVLYRNDGALNTSLSRSAPDGLSWTTIDGQQWRLFVLWDAPRQLQLLVLEPTSHRDDISSRFFYKIAVFGALLVALATLVIWWSINRVFRALRDSALEVAARTPNDLGDVSLHGVPSEVHPLLLAINRLFGRVRHTMEYEQRFTADAAHELRTPLAAIKTNLQVLQRARSPFERDEFIVGLGISVERASRLVDQLLTLARLDPQAGPATVLRQIDLAGLLAEQVESWQEQCAQRGLALKVDLRPAPCLLEPDSLRMLVRNLADNAMRYTPAPGRITISCGQHDGASYLRVTDTGPGIAAAMRERVFERFVRLAGAHMHGSGLGLSIVRRIADSHQASITLAAGEENRGLAVTVRFPPA